MLAHEVFVLFVRRTLRTHGAYARVLHRERGGDDQYLGNAMLLVRREQHARELGVEREPRQLHAHRREAACVIHRVQFLQQAVAVCNHARCWRLDEGKVCDITQVQRGHAQNRAGKRGA